MFGYPRIYPCCVAKTRPYNIKNIAKNNLTELLCMTRIAPLLKQFYFRSFEGRTTLQKSYHLKFCDNLIVRFRNSNMVASMHMNM